MEDDRLEQAIRAIELGNKQAALPLLANILKDNPQNEDAWIWLAVAVEDPQRKRECLEKALQINPLNQDALRELQLLDSGGKEAQLSSEPFTFAGEDQGEIPAGAAVFVPDTEQTGEWVQEQEPSEEFAESVSQVEAEVSSDSSAGEGLEPSPVTAQETAAPLGEHRGPTSYVSDRRSRRKSTLSRSQWTVIIVLVVLTLAILCGTGIYIYINQFM